MIHRVVYDCMVFLQAAARPEGPSGVCLNLAKERLVTLYLSDPILYEIKDVLGRDMIRQKFPALTDAAIESFLRDLEEMGIVTERIEKRVSMENDPKDEKYVNLAIKIDADFLISRDKHLLSLMKIESFRESYPALTILPPEDCLTRIGRGK